MSKTDSTADSAAGGTSTPALELPRLIERMHRRYLDVVRLELARLKADDISPVQYMMLQNISHGGVAPASTGGKAGGEISVRDLIERGYYLGSNASYNLKQLVEGGYVDRGAAARDKRTARLKLSNKGSKLVSAMRQRDFATLEPLLADGGSATAFDACYKLLRQLERRWSEVIRDEQRLDDDLDF